VQRSFPGVLVNRRRRGLRSAREPAENRKSSDWPPMNTQSATSRMWCQRGVPLDVVLGDERGREASTPPPTTTADNRACPIRARSDGDQRSVTVIQPHHGHVRAGSRTGRSAAVQVRQHPKTDGRGRGPRRSPGMRRGRRSRRRRGRARLSSRWRAGAAATSGRGISYRVYDGPRPVYAAKGRAPATTRSTTTAARSSGTPARKPSASTRSGPRCRFGSA
jgi:hypothetical protein